MRAIITVIALVLATTGAAAQTEPSAAAGQHFSGEIGRNAPRASFDIQLQEGQIVTLTTSSAENLDTILTLNGPNGRQVAQNDDQQPGILSSRVIYVARAAGRHTAVITGYNGAAGAFDLQVTYGLNLGLSDEARTLREDRLSFDRRTTEHHIPVDLHANDILVAGTFALSERLDTTLRLVNAAGLVVAQNDDMGDGSLNSRLVYQSADAAHYDLVVSTFEGNGNGDFVLSLALDPKAEAPFNFASIHGTPIANYEGELTDAHASQEYTVDLTAGQTLLAVSDATSGNLDTVLTLNDRDGYPVALNDDRGDGSLNSGFAFTAPQAGRYTLEIKRYDQTRTTGAYRLVLTSVDHSAVDILQALVENPVTLSGPTQTITTPDFHVYYTTEGRDAATPEYAQGVADTLERMLDVQTHRVGWASPIRDSDGHFRAYVANANGDMGYTKPVQMVFDNPNTPNVRERAAARAVLVIDNDFAGMGKKAPPEALMHATVTHEFNHVIQFAYDAQEPLSWLYEATASWTETTTAGADQDATDYVQIDYAAPEMCWTSTARGHNYAQWTLLQSLADQYGEGIVVRMWENSVNYDGFEVMSRTLDSVHTTIPAAIERWRAQNFALDYQLAPSFTRSLQLAGTISRNGRWSPRGRIEQLGANYVALRMQGARTYALRGDDNLVLVGLGVRDGHVDVVPLGRSGVFDTTGYSYSALMVFNQAMPSAPGVCSGVDYSINVSPSGNATPAAAQYQFNAQHFKPLS